MHYLLEPGWRADVAIQGLGRTHRTRQASAPLFRPVATDVKGERRFIATIARRLDSLGAITRGQRDSQSSMGDGALFRAEDNLESPHALSALRLFYISIHNDHVPGWSEKRFEKATGLVLSDAEGGLRDSLPPMSRLLNRVLAMPIDEQNDLFAHFQERLDAMIQAAKDAGVYNLGVETIHADSLAVVARRPGPGGTEILDIRRRDALKPFTADAAAEAVRLGREHHGRGELLLNAQSGRAAVALPAPSAIAEDGAVQPRVRLRRPNAAELLTLQDLARSRWRAAPRNAWEPVWSREVDGLPAHTERVFHLAVRHAAPRLAPPARREPAHPPPRHRRRRVAHRPRPRARGGRPAARGQGTRGRARTPRRRRAPSGRRAPQADAAGQRLDPAPAPACSTGRGS